jgi:hypothetical protein
MKERQRRPAVIRYPRVSIKKDSERYHMNMLRLYLPHRNEKIKPDKYATYASFHITGIVTVNKESVAVKDIVAENMKDFEPATNELDNAWEALQDAADMQDAWAAIAPQAEQQNNEDRLLRPAESESDDDFDEINIPDLDRNHQRVPSLPTCQVESRNTQLTEEQAHSMMRKLNSKQRQIFNHVSKWCYEKANDHTVKPFNIFLTGGAGTGKSHVIRCIQYQAHKAFAPLTESADDVTVLLVAQTGTAAFNIYGQTINSAFKINPKSPKDYTPLAEESLNSLRTKFQHLQLLIIDEISMVNATQLSYIHGRLQQIKGTQTTAWFGNISVLAVGDFNQLPPISPPTPLCFPHKEILKDIWNHRFEIVELTEIMRQKDDVVFAEMLNRLRVRPQNEPLDKDDELLLRSRIVNEATLPPPQDALHLFYRNADVDGHNEVKLQMLDTEKHDIKACDIDQKGGRVIKVNENPHSTNRNDTYLAQKVQLAVGARAMLIANIDVSDGLCNGVFGTVKGIEFRNSQDMPKVVYMEFDSGRVGAKAKRTQRVPPQYSDCVAIAPLKDTFQIKGRTCSTTREQIPLKLAWAVTIHKVQGQTTDRAVISMKGLRTSMAYVALSRVTTLDGMYLTDFDANKIFCNKQVNIEVAKMTSFNLARANPLLEIDHTNHFIIAHHNIQSLRAHLEDMKSNPEMRKAHVICLSETWLTDSQDSLDSIQIQGYSLETANFGRCKGVAIYIQNSVNYTVVPIPRSENCNALAIRTHGKTNLLIAAIYKPPTTTTAALCSELNNITAQIEVLDVDHAILMGDFNINLLTPNSALPPLQHYHQVISESTTTKGTLIDHIYVKPLPVQYIASVLTTYYSYHDAVFIAIKY